MKATLFSFLVVLPFLFACASQRRADEGGVLLRCALDIGSSHTKIKVGEVDADKQRLRTVLYEGRIPVPYHENLLKDSTLPDSVIEDGVKAVSTLISDAQRQVPPGLRMSRCQGIATAAFRAAKNGERAISWISLKTGSTVRIVDQDEEARLGFYSGVSRGFGRDAVVWDIGAASMQIVARNPSRGGDEFLVYRGNIGSESFMTRVVASLQGRDVPTANPMNTRDVYESQRLAREEASRVPPALREVIRENGKIVGIGGVHSIAIPQVLGLKNGRSYHVPELEQAIVKRIGFDDAKLGGKSPQTLMTNLTLVTGFLQELKVNEVIPVEANLTDGVLVNPKYWP